MIAPTDAQWDSPYVVTLKRVPNVDMLLNLCHNISEMYKWNCNISANSQV